MLGTPAGRRILDDVVTHVLFSGIRAQQVRSFLTKAVGRIITHFLALSSEANGGAAAEPVQADTITERRDSQGNVIGMTVARTEKRHIDLDSTLHRDANRTALTSATNPSMSRVRMKQSKKTRRTE